MPQPADLSPPMPAAAGAADLRLTERFERALRATGYLSLRDVVVVVEDRFVRLTGQVPSYHLLQVAQAAALSVAGTRQVRNELTVARPT